MSDNPFDVCMGDGDDVIEFPPYNGTHGSYYWDADFVNDWLAVGASVATEADVEALTKRGITHVINAEMEDNQMLLGGRFEYLHLPTRDDRRPKETSWFLQAIEFARAVQQIPGAKLYVHCTYGIARSPALVYAILRATGKDFGEATMAILAARPQVERLYWKDAEAALDTLASSP